MRYILGVLALLEACDVTNNSRHLGFYQELEIRLKPWEMIFFSFTWKITHKKALWMILVTRFNCWKKLKKHVFSFKIVLTTSTYDVISRNHSNWPSLNLSQNEWRATENDRYWCFILWEKTQKNSIGGGWHPPPPLPPSPVVRPRVKLSLRLPWCFQINVRIPIYDTTFPTLSIMSTSVAGSDLQTHCNTIIL